MQGRQCFPACALEPLAIARGDSVAFGGDQIVVKRHGKPFVAIAATYDLQACQALDDYSDAKAVERARAAGELDQPGVPQEDTKKRLGL